MLRDNDIFALLRDNDIFALSRNNDMLLPHWQACWVVRHFSEARFKKKENIIAIAEGVKTLLLTDGDLPVKVEAAIALQAFLNAQEQAEKHCSTQVRAIVQGSLRLNRSFVSVTIAFNGSFRFAFTRRRC